jgi:hypothetical protein
VAGAGNGRAGWFNWNPGRSTLHHDKDIAVFDFHVEATKPQFTLIGNRFAGAEIEFEAMPRRTRLLSRATLFKATPSG